MTVEDLKDTKKEEEGFLSDIIEEIRDLEVQIRLLQGRAYWHRVKIASTAKMIRQSTRTWDVGDGL